MNTAKLEYSKEELIKQGWATVGGRVEDFEAIAKEDGLEAAYREIEQQYRESADDVYRGMIVDMNYGAEAYYEGLE